MKQKFLSLFGLSQYLILPHKVEHSDKGPTMHPYTHDLHQYGPLFILHNPLGKEHPQAPEPYHNYRLQRQGNQMEP